MQSPHNRHATFSGRRIGSWICAALLSTWTIPLTNAQLNNETSPTHQFKSRPDLHAPILDIQILDPDLVTPGYIFLAPYRNLDPGPYIYDNYGNLVWTGAGQSGPKTAHTPQVCQYKGRDHLCFFEGEQHQGFARGHGVIMDRSYRVVNTVTSSGAGTSSDMHEFKMTPYAEGRTALMTVYQPRQYDLTTNARFNLQHGLGWIVEGVFQEVDIETGSVVFEWRSLDHVDPSQAWTLPGSTDTSGDGLHEQSPWDYFHINSIDKNSEGDYLLSARHVSAIYKVSGKNGQIMWQMGGNSPNFVQTNFQFSYQHHARWISENDTHTVLSFFDNAGNSFNGTGEVSHGWIISIDHVAMTATMIKEWGAPIEGGLLSTSQGNVQMLPNGGCHIGWGEHAVFSEHTTDGTPVQLGKLADRASDVMIYRSNKYNWTAQPVSKPALWSYSRSGRGGHGHDKTSFWVSWNGATEVHKWMFYIRDSTSGPWKYAGSAEKTGFETAFHLDRFALWSYAEAVDHYGRTLEASVIAKTFVPSETLRQYCDDEGCDYAEQVPSEVAVPYEAENQVQQKFLSTNRGYDTRQYYQELPFVVNDLINHDEDASGPERYLSLGSSSLALVMGMLIGSAMAMLGFYVHSQGGIRKLQEKSAEWSDGMTSTTLGSRMLGRYTRVRQSDGLESASLASNRSSL